jgi:hypothetical protein
MYMHKREASMSKRLLVVLAVAAIVVHAGFADLKAQETKKGDSANKLTSERLENDGKELDIQITELCKKIESVIATNNLMANKNIRVLPYQVSYTVGDGFIFIERHNLVRDPLTGRIMQVKVKNMKIYTSGQSISKIESEISEKNYSGELNEVVRMIDPTPTSPGADDILVYHIFDRKNILDGKKLGEVKNSTAFPIRNGIKRDFIVPNLTYFYSVILNIAETYSKSVKDSDSSLMEYLNKSTSY